MKAKVTVRLKSGVLDPQGKAIEGALRAMGIAGVNEVRQGKVFDIELAAEGRAAAEEKLTAMCERLLANTVIESYSIDLTA
jgi:phosphoribosylformylglycinamidine synthase